MVSLKNKAIKGVKWTTLKTGFVATISFVLLFIKARFLNPEEFAHLAILLIFIGLFNRIENFGISQAIIQRESVSREEFSSLFFFNLLLAIFLGIVLFASSSLIATFFSYPMLEYYLKLTSLIILIGGPSHIFKASLEKNMFFKDLSLIEMLRYLITLISITVFLYLGFGVLGVIYANILSVLFSTTMVIFYCYSKKTISISLYFNINKLYPFFRFGFFVAGKQGTTFLSSRVDEIIIGYFLAPEILGIYHFGKSTLEKLKELITASFGKLMLPLFSNIKNDKEKISSAYQKVSKYVAFVSFPIFMGVSITSHLFVPIIFGQQWVDSIIVFQVFSFLLIFKVMTANMATSLLYSVNKPDIVLYIDIITITLYSILLFFFAPYGINAVLIVYSLFVIFKTITLQYYANKQLKYYFFQYFKNLANIFIFSGIMTAVVFFFQKASYAYFNDLEQLIITIILGALSYLILVIIWEKRIVDDFRLFF